MEENNTNHVKKQEFLEFVRETIKENPSWQGEAIQFMQLGATERLEEEINKRTKAEYALAMAYDLLDKKKLDKNVANKTSIHHVLKESSAFKGTKFAEQLELGLDTSI